MKTVAPNPFAPVLQDRARDRLRRALGSELAACYAGVLTQPLPADLKAIVQAPERSLDKTGAAR